MLEGHIKSILELSDGTERLLDLNQSAKLDVTIPTWVYGSNPKKGQVGQE